MVFSCLADTGSPGLLRDGVNGCAGWVGGGGSGVGVAGAVAGGGVGGCGEGRVGLA